MSQATLLEEISLWSRETCERELRSVLPKLVSMHQNTDNWDEHTRILKMITAMFLPHLTISEVEGECFSKVFPKVEKMFSSLMDEISKQLKGLPNQNSELQSCLRNILQIMIEVLEVLSDIVRHFSASEETPAFYAIRSLPSCILKLLKGTFQHCKDSETIYGWRLSLVPDLLQALFKEAYSLQKGLMEFLDKICIDTNVSEEEVSHLVIMIHTLLEICSVLSDLDIALHANTWKFIIKQSLKFQAVLEEHLRHKDIVSCLSDDLLNSFHSCCELAEKITSSGLQETAQCPEYKLFQKTTKMCRFFANTLIHYIKEFKAFLEQSCGRFHHLYLQIFSKMPPSLWSPSVSPSLYSEMNSVVLVAMDPLITQLLPCRAFAEAVLVPKQQFSPELLFPHCLLLVNIVGKLRSQPEEVLRLWFDGSRFPEETPRLSVFQAVFTSFRRCASERAAPVLVPGVMMNGQAQSQVSLHWHVCTQLCACVASLPAPMFPCLEHSLLEAVLQPDTHTALLATDVWCFLARYGTAELCLHHVTIAAYLIKSCPGVSYHLTHLGLLLRRMLFLMTPHHQMEIVEKFPPNRVENMAVWRHVLLRALCNDARTRVEQDIVNASSDMVTGWLESGRKLGQLESVNMALSSLLVVTQGGASETVSRIAKLTAHLWPKVCVQQVLMYPALKHTLKLLLSLSASSVHSLDSSAICQALVCLSSVLSKTCPDDVALAGLDFLASMGQLFIPAEIQSQVLPKLCSLFSVLLAEKRWLLHQCALEAFSLFAEVTNHEEVISRSLTSDETKSKVVDFLSKKVSVQETGEERLKRLKEESCVYEQHNNRMETEEDLVVELQPSSKRARQETGEEGEFGTYLHTAENALQRLLDLTRERQPPLWVTARLHELCVLITQINTARPRT